MKGLIKLEALNEFPSYKGGDTCLYGGYVWEYSPGHHLQNKWGWVAQHRVVIEDKIGRRLVRDHPDPRLNEHVHHIDGSRTNNAPDNLMVLTKSEHHSLESKKWNDPRKLLLDKGKVQRALEQADSIKGAARALGVNHQTLRNRFPELLAPYKRKRPVKLDDPKLIADILRYAADPSIGIEEAARLTGAGMTTVHRVCKRKGVEWVNKREARKQIATQIASGVHESEIVLGGTKRALFQRQRTLIQLRRDELAARDLPGAALRGFLRDPQPSGAQLEPRTLRPLTPASPPLHT